MIHVSRNDMIAVSHDPLDGEIEGIGAVECEDDVFRLVSANQLSDSLPCPQDQSPGLDALEISSASRRSAQFTLIMPDCLQDAIRFGEAGGGVVEVNPLGMHFTLSYPTARRVEVTN